MFRLLHVVSLVALVVFVCGACTAATDERPSSVPATVPAARQPAEGGLRRIRQRGELRVGVKFDVPLFGLRDASSGRLEGFDIEMAEIIARDLLGVDVLAEQQVSFVEAISKDREQLLASGAVDLVISTYTINEARKQLVDFAGPYYVAGQDILASTEEVNSARIRGVADLNGRKVCSVTGSTSLANLNRAAPRADTSLTADRYSTCFEHLRAGRVDAITTDDVILLGLAATDPGRFAIVGNPFHTEPYGVGIPKGDDELRAAVNDALDASFIDGSWAAAFERTVGTVGAVTPNPPTVDRYGRP